MTELDSLVEAARGSFAQAQTPADLENAKALYLGKSGRITEMMKGMAALSVEEKKTFGAAVNVAKQGIEAALNARRQALADAELAVQLKAEAFDVTLPGRPLTQGGLHPVSLTLERIEQIFGSMGFEVAQGPEIETDWFNFTALNTPEDHPARSMHDTFYVEGGHLLRTHTPAPCKFAMRFSTSSVTKRNWMQGRACPKFASLRQAALTVSTAMQPTHPCSISAKVCGLARTSASKI
ncbi:MAG: Phenylalanine--tRNA ligase alpha subunit [Pseudomonadota bacterium]